MFINIEKIISSVFMTGMTAAVLCSPPAFAQESHLDLNSLIKEALANNPGLKVMQSQWQAAKLKIPQSSALPDPMAGYTVMGPMLETPLGPQEDMYEFEQTIPFPGKLFEKRKIAGAQAQTAEANFDKAKRDLILKVSETYYDLYALEENLETLEKVQGLLFGFARTAESAYAGMKASQNDVNKAHIEAAEVKQRSLLLHQQRQSLLFMLGALINREVKEEDLRPFPIFRAPNQPLELIKLIRQAHQHRPEINEAVSSVEAAQHAQSLAKYENAPDISIGFQYFGIGSGSTSDPNDGRDAWMIPIKFTIPLWQNRIVPAVQEAKENLNASNARLEDIENLSGYEVKNAFYKFTTSKEIVDLYEKVLLPQSELALRSETAGYESGNTDFLALVESERLYLNTKIAYHQALADSLKNFAVLERIVGLDLAGQGGQDE